MLKEWKVQTTVVLAMFGGLIQKTCYSKRDSIQIQEDINMRKVDLSTN